MATCYFCKKEFTNTQAVRAHLKACAAYHGRTPKEAPLPDAIGDQQADIVVADPQADVFDPVRQMRQSIAAEKLRLQLREIRGAHSELDTREDARRRALADQEATEVRARQALERERQAAQTRAQLETQARQRAEDSKQQIATKRREVIQSIKNTVINQWFGGWSVTADLKAQMLQAIEVAFSPLPVLELPTAELIQIAQAVRDGLYAKALEARRSVQALTEKIQALQRYGTEYAEQELRGVDGLEFGERLRIESRLREELQDLTGQESRAEIKAWVDDVLEDEGLGLDDEDQAD